VEKVKVKRSKSKKKESEVVEEGSDDLEKVAIFCIGLGIIIMAAISLKSAQNKVQIIKEAIPMLTGFKPPDF